MVTAKQAQAVAERYQKAVELVEAGKVFPLYGELDRYVVVNGQGVAYLVDHVSGECTCPDSQLRCPKLGIVCKHAMAVELYVERRQATAGEQPPQSQAEASEPARLHRIEVDLWEEEQARRLLEYLV